MAACGKKGPPLPPLNLVPDRPATVTARVIDDTVYVHAQIPASNVNAAGAPVRGGTPVVDRLQLYAVTLDKGAVPPVDPRALFTPSHVVGTVEVRPPVDPDAPVDDSAPKDTRPAPGDAADFAEQLTAALRVPQITAATKTPVAPQPAPPAIETPSAVTPASPEAVPAGGAAGGGAGAANLPSEAAAGIPGAFLSGLPQEEPLTAPGTAAPSGAARGGNPAAMVVPSRMYVVRGETRKGRGGPASTRLFVALEPGPPAAPADVSAAFTETAITLTWQAAPAATGVRYNVYDQGAPSAAPKGPQPINTPPIDGTSFERGGAQAGVERCFVVRAVEVRSGVAFESPASAPACVTPRDIFPPAAPTALAAVAGAGAINLIWDANAEPDLAGYLVLRGESPGDTLQPLTPEPIKDTRYADASAQPGVQYVYVVVAVDKAGNRSANSNRVVETAR